MSAVFVGFSLFISVCVAALLLGNLAQRHAASALQRPLPDISHDVRRAAGDKHGLYQQGQARQQIGRMNGFAAFSFSFSGMGLIGCGCWLLLPAVAQGGPAVLGIGWPVIGLFAVLSACIYASSASGMPSTGGVYHWVSSILGNRWGVLAGGLHIAGQAVLYAVSNVLAASWLNMTLSEAFGYEASPIGQYALLAVLFAVQSWTGARDPVRLGRLFVAGAWLEIATMLIVIAIVVCSGEIGYWPIQMIYEQKHPVDVMAASPDATSVLLGLLLLYRGMIGGERAAAMTEETADARVHTPWAIFLSTAYAVVFGYLFFAILLVQIPFSPEAGGLLTGINAIIGGDASKLYSAVAVIVFMSTLFSGAGNLASIARTWDAMARERAALMGERFRIVTRRKGQARSLAVTVVGCAMISLSVLMVHARGGESALPVQPMLLAFLLLHAALAIVAGGRCAARFSGIAILSGPWRLGRIEPWTERLTAAWAIAWLGGIAWFLSAMTWSILGVAGLLLSLTAALRLKKSGKEQRPPLTATRSGSERNAHGVHSSN
ncbi:APC family permease [Paenibacillus methanolicus]|uniref:Amino acid transporter n=1 Tax=Paenibacillus methanolicus TaxID=582686 RepID=A0A5S5C2E9_9BACL|nr:APC family permease [Paenibacillus methanolicus]TYP72510.1 amino acid transporter [Paenibacillus methanolicus]